MRARRALLLAFALIAVWFTGFFPPSNNPNELSRIEAVTAFVETGTFSIDGMIPRLGDTMDKSIWRGRFYSNKAPGLIFAAVPIYRFLRIFFAQPRHGWAAVFVLTRLATVSLVCLWALARFGRRLEENPQRRKTAALVACAAVFATPFVYYGRSFFSHAWTASLLLLAWDLVRRSEQRRRASAGLLAAAGLLAGWAAISEYTVAPIALLLALRAAHRASGSRAKAFLLFAAGAAPPLLLLAAYDAVCFGSPFRLSSACEAFPAYAELARRPLFGLGLPQPSALRSTLFSTTRGVFLFSPFLLWTIPGWVRWWRSRQERSDCVFTLGATLLLWLPIAGYPNWEGGWSLGMRYLVPVLFFAVLAIPWALASALSRGLFCSAVVFSGALHLLASSTWPHFPASLRWPMTSVSAWLLARGAVAPNLGIFWRWPPLISVLPAVVAVSAAFAISIREFPAAANRRALAAGAGVALAALTLALPVSVSSADSTWRQETAEKLRPGPPAAPSESGRPAPKTPPVSRPI